MCIHTSEVFSMVNVLLVGGHKSSNEYRGWDWSVSVVVDVFLYFGEDQKAVLLVRTNQMSP